MARTYRFVVGAAEAGMRLDRYLVRHLPSVLSRTMIQRALRVGMATVGDHPAKANQRLRYNDVIVAHFDQLPARGTDTPLIPQDIPLDIVYEDAHLLVVNKQPGLVTHPAPGHWDGTLVNAILWHLQQARGSVLKAQAKAAQGSGFGAQVGPNSHMPSAQRRSYAEPSAQSPEQSLPRAGIVHRLDKDTSGLLVVAKTEIVHAALSKQLKARNIKRRYLVLVEGHIPLDEGKIDAAIGRHITHRKVMAIQHLGGRSALTHYRVIRRYVAEGSRLKAQGSCLQPSAFSLERALSYTLLEVSLETGRTHQIRVHMAHLGHPILGDTTYGRRTASYWHELGIHRQLLHAYYIRFLHPVTGRAVELSAPIPEDIQRLIGQALNDTSTT